MLVRVVAMEWLGLLLGLEDSKAEFHRTATITERDIRPISLTDDIRLGQPVYSVRHVVCDSNSLHQGFQRLEHLVRFISCPCHFSPRFGKVGVVFLLRYE